MIAVAWYWYIAACIIAVWPAIIVGTTVVLLHADATTRVSRNRAVLATIVTYVGFLGWMLGWWG